MPVDGSYSQRRSLRFVKRLPRKSGVRWESQATPLHNRGMACRATDSLSDYRRCRGNRDLLSVEHIQTPAGEDMFNQHADD